MSLLGTFIRQTGIYDRLRAHFFEQMLVPFSRAGIRLEEARFLADLVREACSERPIVEVGTLFGASTKVIALNKARSQPLICVDVFRWNPAGLTPDQHYSVANATLKPYAADGNLTLLRQDKGEFYRMYSGPPPALVFLDADHSYEGTAEDIRWAKAVGASVICGHDYTPKMPGVMRAVDENGGAKEVRDTLWRLT